MTFKEFCIKSKHFLMLSGAFGKAKKIEYYLSSRENSGYNVNHNEWKKSVQKIKSKYTEIRVHTLWSTRIGEYLVRYLRAVEDSAENEKKGILDVFVLSDCINHNSRLSQIMGRHICIIDDTNVEMWRYILRHFPNVQFAKCWADYEIKKNDRLRNSKDTVKYFELTAEEEAEGMSKMKAMQLQQPFVCVSSRDKAYLHSTFTLADCTYHDYRDSDINNFNLAADYLTQEGITSVRTGREVDRTVEFDNCIDYASNYYDELMDIVLAKKCKFYVCDSCGVTFVPMVLNKPVALKNLTPAFLNPESWPYNPQNLVIFKKHYLTTEKRFLSIREMMEVEIKAKYDGHKYAQYGIEMVENSAEEILDLVIEMNERLDGVWVEKAEDIELQDKFQKIYRNWCERQHYQESEILNMRVGTAFLKKNLYLLE